MGMRVPVLALRGLGHWPVDESAVNMLVLYWVGSELEAIYGSKEFLGFYLAAALLISLAEVVMGLMGFGDPRTRTLGASGAVNAAFVVYACHYPYRQIMLFFIL